jgi:hypothetical protein
MLGIVGKGATLLSQNYVQIHQDSHNKLLELKEPMPEMKKV